MNEESMREINEEIAYATAFVVGEKWHRRFFDFVDPRTGKKCDLRQAYDIATERFLRKNGWRNIIEYIHTGKIGSKFASEQMWSRFQSPKTGRVYNFLEAQDIIRYDHEDTYPDFCSQGTILRNQLIGDNFQKSEIYTICCKDFFGLLEERVPGVKLEK